MKRLGHFVPLPLRRRMRAVADRLHGGQRHVLELPERLTEPPGDRILVFAPHQDDEVLGCGGALARHHDAGHHSVVAFMTDGREGYQFTSLRGDSLVAARRAEAERAAQQLGIRECVFLDNPDTRLWACRGAGNQVAALMSRVRPDVVYLPSFTDTHTDHLHTFFTVADAVLSQESQSSFFLYETWAPLVANCVIGIDMERKLAALRAHVSQLGPDEIFVPAIRGLARYRAATCLLDMPYAECFWKTDLAGLRELTRWLR